MSAKSSSGRNYVGSRALFDPFYLPPELIGLNKECSSIQSFLRDAIQDRYPIVLSLYGLQGVGKSALIRKVLTKLTKSETESNTKRKPEIEVCYANCAEKEPNEIAFSLINKVSNFLNYDLAPNAILNANLGSQINLLTHLLSKLTNSGSSILFFLDSIEYTQPQFINKILDVSHSESCILVTSFNLLKSSPYLVEFKKSDMQIQLNNYTPSHLERISRDRCNLAFKHPVEPIILRYLTDFVSNFDYCVPESCIRVLRELYPLIESKAELEPDIMQDMCRTQFNRYSIDEISIAEFISETDLVDRLGLDEIGSFFRSQNRYYISYSELVNSYKVACENLECDFLTSHFHSFLAKLERIGLLVSSIFTLRSKEKLYFLTISPKLFSEILDVAFGMISFE